MRRSPSNSIRDPSSGPRADVIVVFFFDSDRPCAAGPGAPTGGSAVSCRELILSGKLTGAPGEAVLMPTGGGLAAPLLIGLGLGAPRTRSTWTPARRSGERR